MSRARRSPVGRGVHYGPIRQAIERVARVAYTGDWPARLWARVPGATKISVEAHTLPMLPRGPTLRLGFVSDLHLGPTTPIELVRAAFAALSAAAPDVVILGGDYVYLDATPRWMAELEALVGALPVRTKLAVLGNHDLWTHHERIEAALERAGARVLVNDAVLLPPPHGHVAILGLDDPWSAEPDARPGLSASRTAEVRIAACHAPEGLLALGQADARLLVCGHTHGGQIAPFGWPLWVPGPVSSRHPAGLFALGGRWLWVSRGVGAVDVPVRVRARPDVGLFTLVEEGTKDLTHPLTGR